MIFCFVSGHCTYMILCTRFFIPSCTYLKPKLKGNLDYVKNGGKIIFISQLVEANYSNAQEYFDNEINPFVQYCCGYFTSKIVSVEVLIFVK